MPGGGRVESHLHSGLMPNPAAGPDRPSYFNRHLSFLEYIVSSSWIFSPQPCHDFVTTSVSSEDLKGREKSI